MKTKVGSFIRPCFNGIKQRKTKAVIGTEHEVCKVESETSILYIYGIHGRNYPTRTNSWVLVRE